MALLFDYCEACGSENVYSDIQYEGVKKIAVMGCRDCPNVDTISILNPFNVPVSKPIIL